MVARGDLALEFGYAKVPTVQRRIIELCAYYKKPVIVATQMLMSMVTEINPTRAEVSDVANAVYSGVDAVMLSDEATKSPDPSHVVEMMSEIVIEAEKETYGCHCDDDCDCKKENNGECCCGDECGCGCGCCGMEIFPFYPEIVKNTDAIVVVDKNYDTTRIISNARLPQKIYSFTDNAVYKNQMALLWNVEGIKMNISDNITDTNIKNIEKEILKRNKNIKKYLFVANIKNVPTIQVREVK